MAVLVTGGAGYIGSHMVLELLDHGERAVILDNLSTGLRRLAPDDAIFVQGDVGDEALLDNLLPNYEVESILHFAGSIVVPESIKDPLGYYYNNTVKSRALMAAAVRHGVKNFIFSSTAAVYGTPEQVPVAEGAQKAPISPYGSSKLMTEQMLADAGAAHPLRYCALRYFNVAGADPQSRSGQSSPKATHLIKVASEVVTGQRPYMSVFGTDYPTPDGTCIRDYIHVADLAEAHVAAVRRLIGGGDSAALNLGIGRGSSVREILAVVEKVTGHALDAAVAPRRPGDPAMLFADPARAKAALGWTPRFTNVEDHVRHAWRWAQRKRNS